jgi:microcystin-dependent protein
MASTYSPSLRITLIGDGEQSGTWGTTTNTNLGSIIEQAITGVQTILLSGTTYTLSTFDGSVDESRNQVLIFTGTLSANCTVTAPSVEKTYVVVNNTTGGFAVRMTTSAGTPLAINSGRSSYIYCDGTNFYAVGSSNSVDGNLTVSGNTDIGGNLNVSGTINASNVGIIPGGILMWPTDAAPTGFLICNGNALATATYPALFAAIGYTFGGSGSVFNLPNYTNRMPIGAGGTYALGATGGSATTSISTTNIPGHTHSFSGSVGVSISGTTSDVSNLHSHGVNTQPTYSGFTASFSGGTDTGANGCVFTDNRRNGTQTNDAGNHTHTFSGSGGGSFSGTTGSTGSGSAFNTISPYLGMYFVIKT